jgi:hypothetical protein
MTFLHRHALVSVAAFTVVIGAALLPATTHGAFSGTTAAGASSAVADMLSPPTDFEIDFTCQLFGILLPVANLSWTPTDDGWASGYVLERLNNVGTLLSSTPILGGTTALISDGIALPHLSLSTTYTWRLRASFHSWVSTDATVTATTPALCL